MADYKQLCAELVNELHGYKVAHPNHDTDLINRARAELAKPEPEGPTDEELDELFTEIEQSGEPESWRAYARAVLTRWSNRQEILDGSMPQPVPVSERLPGPGDCDVKGMCWWFAPETYSQWNRWVFSRGNGTEKYWLPHNALHLLS